MSKNPITAVKLKVLIIEDNEDDLILLLDALRRGGFDPNYKQIQTKLDLQTALENETWQVAISDDSLPGFNSRGALELVRPFNIPFFVVSGTIDERTANEMMRLGAQDYVMKGNLARLVPAIHRELEAHDRRQTMQNQLRQAQKMEAIGLLAGGIAHDFNNFLATILMMSENLMHGMTPDNPAMADLKRIQDVVTRAAGLTRQLLTFSRKQSTKPVNLQVNAVVQHMHAMLASILGSRINFQLSLAEDIGGIKIDRNQLEQTILNLIINARDAMGSTGKLSVSTANRTLPTTLSTPIAKIPPGEYVVVEVEDTGCGMDKETMERVFEPFFTTKGDKGTGLGLSTILGIVQAAEGHIAIKSVPGQGTTFTVYFPKCDPPAKVDAASGKTAAGLQGSETILVVEDQVSFRNAIQIALSGQNYKVISAGTATEALNVWRQNRDQIQLVITDLNMPDVGGGELIKQINTENPATKVILMSGYFNERLFDPKAFSIEIQTIEKPFQLKVLLEKIRAVLDSGARAA